MLRLRLIVIVALLLPFALVASTAPDAGASSAASLCATSNLKITEAGGEGAAGTRILTIAYQNQGKATCRISGIPGVTLYAAADRKLAVARRSLPARISQIVLEPRSRAYGDITYLEQPMPGSQECPVPTKLRIYPPDNARPVLISLRKPSAGAYCRAAQVYPLATTGQKSLMS